MGAYCGVMARRLDEPEGYKRMLKGDRRWNKLSSRIALYTMVARFFWNAGPAMLRALTPGYHPSKVEDPQWVERWAEAYEGLEEGEIPLLDTSNPEIPARFA